MKVKLRLRGSRGPLVAGAPWGEGVGTIENTCVPLLCDMYFTSVISGNIRALAFVLLGGKNYSEVILKKL